MMNYFEAVDYINNIPRFTKKNEPDKTKAFLNLIGDFSKTIPTIHVAGTNGKGSVCAYLRAGLIASGLKICMFTSPHLVDITERFMLDNKEISKEEFTDLFNEVMGLVKEMNLRPGFEDYHPTFFEILFFMAALWFNKVKPDFVILETGLGGRLDATNSIECPVATVITEIGLDHCEYLGNTKEEIAFEKAGIIKENVPVIFADRIESVSEVFIKVAAQKHAPFFAISNKSIKNFETSSSGIDFSIQSLYDESEKISLKTNALFQVENAGLSFRTLEVLSKKFSSIDMNKCIYGFSEMVWPGRMEKVSDNFIIDGAHNEDGINAFLDTVKCDGKERRALLYSAVSDKDVEKVALKIIKSNLFDKIYVAKMDSYRACDLERLKASFRECDDAFFFDSVKDAYFSMKKEAGSGTLMYSAGSLYLVSELKVLLTEEET